jgi:hypothetical protein
VPILACPQTQVKTMNVSRETVPNFVPSDELLARPELLADDGRRPLRPHDVRTLGSARGFAGTHNR